MQQLAQVVDRGERLRVAATKRLPRFRDRLAVQLHVAVAVDVREELPAEALDPALVPEREQSRGPS